VRGTPDALDQGIMPRKTRRSRSRSAPPPAPSTTEDAPVEREHDLADRRDRPSEGHVNVGPDDRAPGHVDDVEHEDQVPDVDSWVIERVASQTDRP